MPNNTKEILKKYDIRLDKNKSQNYLIDNNKLNNILKHADINDTETVLEIGAGIGTLTIPMSKQAKKVIAIEKDKKIAEVLKKRVADERIDNIEVICNDALKMDYPHFDKVVSNLPYQISSPVTFKLLEYDFKKAVLMYQYEFAKRMQASYGSSDYSRLSVALYFRCDVKIIDTLSPSSFIPQPKVNSAVIELIPKECDVDKIFDDTTRALFQHRNKKAKKALINSAHEVNMDKKVLKELLNKEDNPLLEKKVFNLKAEEILEVSSIIKNLGDL